jgi:hypothetical protein
MAADILEIQNRLIALCKLPVLPTTNPIPDAKATEAECSFADDELPVFVVTRGPGIRHQWIDADCVQVTREYLLKLFVLPIQDGTKPGTDEPQLSAAADCVLPVVLFFGARRALELDDGGIVDEAHIVQDTDAVRRYTVNSRIFSGVLFRMQVTTRHIVAGEDL